MEWSLCWNEVKWWGEVMKWSGEVNRTQGLGWLEISAGVVTSWDNIILFVVCACSRLADHARCRSAALALSGYPWLWNAEPTPRIKYSQTESASLQTRHPTHVALGIKIGFIQYRNETCHFTSNKYSKRVDNTWDYQPPIGFPWRWAILGFFGRFY